MLRGAERTLRAGRVRMLTFEFSPRLIPAPKGCGASDVREGRLAEAVDGLRFLERLGADCVPCDEWTSLTAVRKFTAPMSISDYVHRFRQRGNFFDNIVCDMSRARRSPTRV